MIDLGRAEFPYNSIFCGTDFLLKSQKDFEVIYNYLQKLIVLTKSIKNDNIIYNKTLSKASLV